MDRKQVEKLLEEYRQADKAIKITEQLIAEIQDQFYLSLSTSSGDGLPKSTGGMSSKTEQAAVHVPSGVFETIEAYEREIDQAKATKKLVQWALKKLPFAQRRIVRDFYIRGKIWREIAKEHDYSIRQCQRIRDEGLDNLSRKLEAHLASFGQNEWDEK